MKKLNLKIKTKIMLMNMGILIPIIIFIYIITINNLYSNVIKSSVDFLTEESYNTQLYITSYIENDNENSVESNFINKASLINTYLYNKLKFRTQIYNNSGEILADSVMNSVALYDKDINNAINGDKAYIVKKIDGHIYILFSIPIYSNNNTLGCVRYIYLLDKGENIVHNMIMIMAITVILAIIISLILSNIFSENIVEPIEKLKNISQKIAKGDYENKIDIKSGDEIEDLAKSFNIMSHNVKKYTESLKEEKKKHKEFFDNVTHEFKTPLTAIIGYSDLIPRLEDKEDIEDSLKYIKNEGERLLTLVEELLDLSKIGKSQFNINITKNNLKDIIKDTLSIIRPRLEKYDIEIIEELRDIDIFIDKDKTKQVFLNILDNAIKHSECSCITIKMIISDDNVIVNIIDDGNGIDKSDLENIFEMKLQSKNGNGLGLAICKEIMKKQAGDIKVFSEDRKWTSVNIAFNKNI